MKKQYFLMVFLFSLPCFAVTKHDWFIDPGVKVGPITSTTTLEDLAKIFGSTNVKEGKYQSGEIVSKAIYIYPNDSQKKISIHDMKSPDHPNQYYRSINIDPYPGVKSKWQTKEGITIGTTLKEIVRLNGGPVELQHWHGGWDISRVRIKNWAGGKIKVGLDDKLIIIMHPKLPTSGRPPYWKLGDVDGTFLSNERLVEKAELQVTGISVRLGEVERLK